MALRPLASLPHYGDYSAAGIRRADRVLEPTTLAHCAVETDPSEQEEHAVHKATTLAIGRAKDHEDHVANGGCIAASLCMTVLILGIADPCRTCA